MSKTDPITEVYKEMTATLKYTNRRFDLCDKIIVRIEKKLFTQEENMAFYLELGSELDATIH